MLSNVSFWPRPRSLLLAAVAPASAQQVLKVGSTPTGVPFTFLDTKTNSIQGIMVDLITEVGKDAGLCRCRSSRCSSPP